jgi:hypothetical protein
MEGGTTFHFAADGVGAAPEQAFNAADGKDVRLYGGAATVQQYLRAGLIDDLHLVIVPLLLGGGERLFDNPDGGTAGCECVELISSPAATHARLSRARTGHLAAGSAVAGLASVPGHETGTSPDAAMS